MSATSIILIIAHKENLSHFEAISLQQCCNIFGSRRIVLICPKGLDVSHYKAVSKNVEIDFINPKWQKDYASFNRLKIAPFLYQRYSQYEYILFYELDAFVFRDDLDYWCSRGFDYIGAPWTADELENGQPVFNGVGNGGLSLRKISSHLKVLSSFRKVYSTAELYERYRNFSLPAKMAKLPSYALYATGVMNNTYWLLNTFAENEDIFWGLHAFSKPGFNLPSSAEAISFSFERFPSKLFELNNHQLPFGCHGWFRYEFAFWKPHIEKYGYILDETVDG